MGSLSENLAKPPLGASMLIATIMVNLLGLALPLVMLQVFDRVIPNQALETLLVLIAGLSVAVLLDFTLKACRIVVATHAGEEFELKTMSGVVRRMFKRITKITRRAK